MLPRRPRQLARQVRSIALWAGTRETATAPVLEDAVVRGRRPADDRTGHSTSKGSDSGTTSAARNPPDERTTASANGGAAKRAVRLRLRVAACQHKAEADEAGDGDRTDRYRAPCSRVRAIANASI